MVEWEDELERAEVRQKTLPHLQPELQEVEWELEQLEKEQVESQVATVGQ